MRLLFTLAIAMTSPAYAKASGGNAVAFAGLVPASIAPELAAALQTAPHSGAAFANQAVTFVSGESFSQEHEAIINSIAFVPSPALDLWLMRQRIARDTPVPKSSLLALAVDKTVQPPRAYFVEFDGEALVPPGSLPKPRPFSAACFTCHASGPRAIRPRTDPGVLPELTGSERATIAEWNKTIAAYRVVSTHKPVFSRTQPWPPIALYDAVSNERLEVPVCAECHGNGVRAPLLRQHRETILALIDHRHDENGDFAAISAVSARAYMPMETMRLSREERRCLVAWLERTQLSSPLLSGCDRNGAPVAAEGTTYVVDSANSSIHALAKATVGDIAVNGLFPSGSMTCRPVCDAALAIDLRNLRTGVTLRDQHLKDLLLVASQPVATATLVAIALPSSDFADKTFHLPLQLTLKGISSTYPADLTCTRGATISCDFRFEANLGDHDITPPSFLGATVANSVAVTGTLRFVPQRRAK